MPKYRVGHHLQCSLISLRMFSLVEAEESARFQHRNRFRPIVSRTCHVFHCLTCVKPPLAQRIACDTIKVSPQPHFEGRFHGSQSYRNAISSRNSDFVRLKMYRFNGSAFNQLEDPFRHASSKEYSWFSVVLFFLFSMKRLLSFLMLLIASC